MRLVWTTCRDCVPLCYVAGLLVERESAKTIQVWSQGMNPELGDQSPAALLPGEPRDDVDTKAIVTQS